MYQSQFEVKNDLASLLTNQNWNQPSENDKASINLFKSLVKLNNNSLYQQIEAQLPMQSVINQKPMPQQPIPQQPMPQQQIIKEQIKPQITKVSTNKLNKLEIIQQKQQVEQEIAKIIHSIKSRGLVDVEEKIKVQLQKVMQMRASNEQ